MVQKLVARIGRSTDLPVMLVGELGFDTDVLVARFGDGSPAAPRIMTDKSSGNFEYLNIGYVKYPEIQMIAGGTVDGVDLSDLNTSNGFLIRNGDNSWGSRIFTNSDGYFDILNGDGTTGNPVVNASSTLVALLTASYLTSVTHDSTLTGAGTALSPLSVTVGSTTQPGSLSLATQAEVNAGILTNKAISPSTLQGRQASDTLTGLIEIATQVEVDLGTDTVRALTPATFNNKTATDTRRGVVELATNAEILTGTDTTRVITPSGLTSYFVANPSVAVATQVEVNTGVVTNKYVAPNTLHARVASETLTGLVELATLAEVVTGTDTTRVITPSSLSSLFADASRKASQVEVDAGSVVSKYVAPNTLAARTALTTRTGLIALATQAEANALTENTKAITSAVLYGRKATDAEVIAGVEDTKYITAKQAKDYSGTSFKYPSILASWPGMGGSADDIINTTLTVTPVVGSYLIEAEGRFYSPSTFEINVGGVWVFLGGIGGPLVGNRSANHRFTVDSSLRVFNKFDDGYSYNILSGGAVWNGQVRVTLITVDNAWPSSMKLSKMLSY